MDIHVENNIDRIDRDQWNALARQNPVNTVFQTFEFNRAAQAAYGRGDGSFILCVKDKGRLIAIFPLLFTKVNGKRTLQFMAGERSDYCDLICPQQREEVLEMVWACILSRRREWDIVHLSNIPLETSLARYMKENKDLKRLVHRSSQDEAVYLRFKEDQAHTQEVLSKKKVLGFRRYFQTHGGYRVLHLHRSQDIAGYLEDFFAQHIKRWQGSLYPSLFLDEVNKEFYRCMVQGLPQGWITFTVIQFKDHILGYHLGFSYGKSFVWYKPTFNKVFGQHSPGQVLLQEVMEYANAQGFEEFDLGVGKDPYKHRFGNKVRRNNSFKVFSSRGAYLCYYIPLAIQWRVSRLFAK